MKDTNEQYIGRRERIMGFIYILLIFMASSGICIWYLFGRNDDLKLFTQKESVVTRMDRMREYRQVQERYAPRIDSLYRRIDRFQPDVIASYEENEINILIRELGDVYERHSYDKRYKVFRHSADYCRMWFDDKKEYWGLRENIARFHRDLEACEIGLQKKTDELKGNKSK